MFEVSTSAPVDIAITNNATWSDAFQFGDEDDTTWSFTGCIFHMDVKANDEDSAASLSLTTANGRIVVDDATTRVLHFNASAADVDAALPPGDYVYDLIMIDGSSIRTVLMNGSVFVEQGVTMS